MVKLDKVMIMKIFVLLSLLLLANLAVFGQEDKYPALPPEKLKLRTDLESDKSILSIKCRLGWEIPKGNPGYEELKKAQTENSRISRLLYQASLTNDKTVKAKTVCSSKEGTLMVSYLIVDKGKTDYIADYSRDEFGAFKFEKYDCDELKIGTYSKEDKTGKYIFVPLEEYDSDEQIIVLQCKTENRDFIF